MSRAHISNAGREAMARPHYAGRKLNLLRKQPVGLRQQRLILVTFYIEEWQSRPGYDYKSRLRCRRQDELKERQAGMPIVADSGRRITWARILKPLEKRENLG